MRDSALVYKVKHNQGGHLMSASALHMHMYVLIHVNTHAHTPHTSIHRIIKNKRSFKSSLCKTHEFRYKHLNEMSYKISEAF